MKILLVHDALLPVFAYGGTERVVWDLAKGLVSFGHDVELLAGAGSTCEFAKVRWIDKSLPLATQYDSKKYDVVHFQSKPDIEPDHPYIVTEHGNTKNGESLLKNTVFLSSNHAARYGSSVYVYNGLDWSAYGEVDLQSPRNYFHFLGKAAWPVKNVKGAISVAKRANVHLAVLGGHRLNLSRGFRFTLSRAVSFYGMVGGDEKNKLIQGSRGLIFPVRWHEPFGLAVIESMYFGCPVFSTPYGAIPEIVTDECGSFSVDAGELAFSIERHEFEPRACHARALEEFNHLRMARDYLLKYEQVIERETLNISAPCLIDNGHRLLPWKT